MYVRRFLNVQTTALGDELDKLMKPSQNAKNDVLLPEQVVRDLRERDVLSRLSLIRNMRINC